MTRNARILCVQTRPLFGEVTRNLDAVSERLEGCRADLIVLPELFATGYAFCDVSEVAALAETFRDGETVHRLALWSKRTGAVVVGGYVERDGDHFYNAALLAAGGEARLSYRKIHLFGYEPELYAPGDAPPPVYEHEGLRVGVMICFDWIFPETARLLALAGADVIAHPSNLVLPWCQRSMPTRALENRLFTATANRVGREARLPRPPLSFTGGSLVCAPTGEVRARASSEAEEVLEVEINVDEARAKLLPSGNDPLAERRPDLYGGLTAPFPSAAD